MAGCYLLALYSTEMHVSKISDESWNLTGLADVSMGFQNKHRPSRETRFLVFWPCFSR